VLKDGLNPFTRLTWAHTAHEIGHMLGLADAEIPGTPGVLNDLNLMMNRPPRRLQNCLDNQIRTQPNGTFQDQLDVIRANAGPLDSP